MRAASVTVQPGLFDGEEPTEPDGYMSTPEASALYAAILATEAKAAGLSRALGEGFALDVLGPSSCPVDQPPHRTTSQGLLDVARRRMIS